jgi:hypothetical protein
MILRFVSILRPAFILGWLSRASDLRKLTFGEMANAIAGGFFLAEHAANDLRVRGCFSEITAA